MPDREKVIKGLKQHRDGQFHSCDNCPYVNETGCQFKLYSDALTLLKEQEVRELTMDEWQEWKNNPKRNPVCKLWEHDTSPMWILNPNDVHEPALLMGKLKLFTGKPTFEQCMAVKWNGSQFADMPTMQSVT